MSKRTDFKNISQIEIDIEDKKGVIMFANGGGFDKELNKAIEDELKSRSNKDIL